MRSTPKRGGRPRPIKHRKPRGLGKGRIPTATTRMADLKVKPQPELTPAERAHAIASLNRRLPLS